MKNKHYWHIESENKKLDKENQELVQEQVKIKLELKRKTREVNTLNRVLREIEDKTAEKENQLNQKQLTIKNLAENNQKLNKVNRELQKEIEQLRLSWLNEKEINENLRWVIDQLKSRRLNDKQAIELKDNQIIIQRESIDKLYRENEHLHNRLLNLYNSNETINNYQDEDSNSWEVELYNNTLNLSELTLLGEELIKVEEEAKENINPQPTTTTLQILDQLSRNAFKRTVKRLGYIMANRQRQHVVGDFCLEAGKYLLDYEGYRQEIKAQILQSPKR